MFDERQHVAGSHRNESEDELQLEKGTTSSSISEPRALDINPVRTWDTGRKTRFPIAGAICLFIILMCSAGIAAVVLASDNHDFDVWGHWYYPHGLRVVKVKKWHRYAVVKGPVDFVMSVNVWISVFVFVCTKLLAFAFLESVTVYWWRQAMMGKTLRKLQHDYEAGRSITAVFTNLKLFNWLCVCTIAFTIFGSVGPILQKSSITQIKSTGWMEPDVYIPKQMYDMTTPLAKAFPAGGSGLYNANGSLIGWSDLTWSAADSYEESPQTLSRLLNPVSGCPPLNPNRALSKCIGFFETIGWNYTCLPDTTTDIDDLNTPQTFFDVNFSYDAENDPWSIHMNLSFKENGACTGKKAVRHRHCVLSPAIVELPIVFDMFEPGNSSNLNGDPDILNFNNLLDGDRSGNATHGTQIVEKSMDFRGHYNVAFVHTSGIDATGVGEKVSFDGVKTPFYIDSAVREARYHTNSSGHRDMSRIDDPAPTIGGFASAFNGLVGTSYKLQAPSLNDSTTLVSTNGTWFLDYLHSVGDNPNQCATAFLDPTQGVVNAVREFMLRYSVLVQYYDPNDEGSPDTWNPNGNNYTSTQPILDGRWKWYNATRNVYHTSSFLVAIGVFIMLFGIVCTCSLYWGFWQLGRKVSLSPFEMSRALALPDKPEAFGVRANEASNVPVDDLMMIVGDVKVKYGEIAPGILGMGLADDVNLPQHGQHYR